ncbi:MAG TPA: glycoside hydrolase family 43 protein [Pseudonocardia sp.]|nr:glycoside hydrolase family 43 protein [Pseudonocardia sp.]
MRIPILDRLFRSRVPAPDRPAQLEIEPLIDRDFPDPDVISVDGEYFAYSTNSVYDGALVNVPVWRAPALGGPWSMIGDAMPELPAWVADSAHGGSHVWAPDVVPASQGGYLLYFTAHHARHLVQCLGVAVSASPAGPFRAVGDDALVVQPEDGDTLDATSFVDGGPGTGRRYLIYKSGRLYSTVWLRELSADGTRAVSDRRELFRSDRREEANIVESPLLVQRGRDNGSGYVVFYSANWFNSGRHFVNYATADRIDGMFTKAPGALLTGDAVGDGYSDTGHQDVVAGPDGDYLFFHALGRNRERAMFAVGLDWTPDGEPLVASHRPPRPAGPAGPDPVTLST